MLGLVNLCAAGRCSAGSCCCGEFGGEPLPEAHLSAQSHSETASGKFAPPSATSDRICHSAKDKCDAGEWQTSAPTYNTDRGCQRLSVCHPDTQYIAQDECQQVPRG